MTATGMPAQMDVTGLIAGIMAFRLIYFIIPGAMAITALLRPPLAPPVAPKSYDNAKSARLYLPRAESGVVFQNNGQFQNVAGTTTALWPIGQALVAMFDPSGRPKKTFFNALAQQARHNNRFALLYKCSARTAQAARHAKWFCVHIADDAILSLKDYSLEGAERSRLRRKLRKAAKSDVTVRTVLPTDLEALADTDLVWQMCNGPARGGTMGRFCPQYVEGQHIVMAEKNGECIAFASFHRGPAEWALDLMRQGPAAPDGTMHAVVQCGIDEALQAGAQYVSLAAVPACPNPHSSFWRWYARQFTARAGGSGLRQFKSAFGPQWRPLYVAAPSLWGLVISLADVARAVHYPHSLTPTDHKHMSASHNKDENYEVDSSAAA